MANPKGECKAITLRSGKGIEEATKSQENHEEEAAERPENRKKEEVPSPSSTKPILKPYVPKFLKELMTRKRNWGEKETVVLTEECSAIIQKKLPQKMKDPGSFQIPCIIGDITIEKALCDLGTSINLMSLNMMRKMRIEEAKPTRMALQLADRKFKFPHEVVEDLLVKVGEFIFPADFAVLNMEEKANTSIILGRPFLATARAIIDVQKGELVLRLHEEKMVSMSSRQ
ncbi:uncharacterized protein LOC107493719 [Arachis duranensis]|uniref:Uncharacterized protein LOC107493719 n=1 Tax=Arachis duranensis TaxID=130453 RepID=A0A6P4DLF7_ARADU|nr:uncharacterized protein LOC107493719 [Arachis duranensis]